MPVLRVCKAVDRTVRKQNRERGDGSAEARRLAPAAAGAAKPVLFTF